MSEGGKDDSVIASNQARNETCRFKKAMMMKMMMAMIRDVRGQHFSLRKGETIILGRSGAVVKIYGSGQGSGRSLSGRGKNNVNQL